MSCGQYTESAAGRIRVVTSGTRPTGVDRYVGQRIFESDTGRELLYDGTGWVIMSEPTQTYTPALTNVTLGNGTNSGQYHRSDGYVDFATQLVLGSTSAITGAVAIGLPINAGGLTGGNAMPAQCLLFDASVGLVLGVALVNGTTAVYPSYLSSLAGAATSVNTTTPFTWANGDAIWIKGRYRMTTRYS